MTLEEKQYLFGELQPLLFMYARILGYHPIMGYGFRDEETQKRMVDKGASKTLNSNHLRCLAVDMELKDKEGTYITDDTGHVQLGKFWESLHPLCKWGGRFGDYNHYSITHDGVI